MCQLDSSIPRALGLGIYLMALLLGCSNASDCETPDEACPDEAPYYGSLCVGALQCFYTHPDYISDPQGIRLDCVEGRWQETILCPGCPPRTHERCTTPDLSDVPDAHLDVVLLPEPVVFGPQGAVMVAHTLEVSGLEDATRCVAVRERTFLDGMPAPATLAVLLRCGQSRTIYALLYDFPCGPGVHRIELEVSIDGVGSARTGFDYDASQCPPLGG